MSRTTPASLFVVLAWIFVIFRLLQAYVHVTSNIVRLRGAFFGISAPGACDHVVIYHRSKFCTGT